MPAWRLAAVAAVALGCYLDSLQGALLFDDVNAIVENRLVRDFDVARIVTTPSWWGEPDRASWAPAYRPVTSLTFAVEHRLHGLDPLGYHVVNVLLHAAVCVLLAVVLAATTGDGALASGAALLFAAHPVHTEAVASVVGRAELLAALLGLAGWALVVRRRTALRLGAAAVILGAAVLAKENAVAILPLVVVADALYEPSGLRGRIGGYAVLAAGVAAAIVVHTAVLGGLGPPVGRLDNVLAVAPVVPRVWTALAVVARYAGTLVWPFALSADHSYPQIELATAFADPTALAGLAITLALAAAAIWGWRRDRHVAFGVAVLALPFAVVSNLVFPIGTIMAERLLYLPSVGFCLLVALAIDRLGRRRTLVVATATAILVVAWGWATVARNRVWRDRHVFFQAMVADAPRSARSHRELGLVHEADGRIDAAIAELRTSLELLPGDATTLYDLGNVLLRAGRSDDAIAAYGQALAASPDFVPAMINLGNAHSARGDEPTAASWFARALARDPGATQARMNLANSLVRQGRLAEAEPHYRETVRQAPGDALVRVNYAAVLGALGRPQEAGEQYRAALALPPKTADAAVAVVTALAGRGMIAEARAMQAKAERLFPADAGVRRMRAGLGP